MWARVVEVMLGVWLAISPFVFQYPPDASARWASDWICASLVILFALLSYWRPAQYIHLAAALVALWMFGFGWFQPRPVPGGLQNEMVTGIILLMTCLVPNHAGQPPQGWREYYQRAAENEGADHG